MRINNRLGIENQQNQRGFTLIELSIVLVIIGLIVGGILVGQDLIRAAEIRATISQIEKYNSAVNTFRGKYNGIPGDLQYQQANAFGFFTFSAAAGSVGLGDGNGLIENQGGPCTCSPTLPCSAATSTSAGNVGSEQFVFWRHLSDANLIDGNFGSNLNASGNNPAATTDVSQYFPPAKVGNGMYFVVASDGSYNYFALGTLVGVGAPAGGTSYWLTFRYSGASPSAGLTPVDAYAIDTKLDDGLPNTGSVQAITVDWNPIDTSLGNAASWGSPPASGQGYCITGGSGSMDTTAVYSTGLSTGGAEPACAMEFRFN